MFVFVFVSVFIFVLDRIRISDMNLNFQALSIATSKVLINVILKPSDALFLSFSQSVYCQTFLDNSVCYVVNSSHFSFSTVPEVITNC